jgi:predicted CXXCH cytochrome family protein
MTKGMMKAPRCRIKCCPRTVFTVAASLVYILTCGGIATAGYANSAHGNTSYGVDRSGTTYAIGSCAHCHDTFDESICGVNALMLFDLSDEDFCLGCHDNTTDPSDRAIVNRSYSYRAGGYTTDPLNDIQEAFSSTTHHDLDDIKTFINGKWGYTADSNPCNACHDHHKAQGDPENAPDDPKGVGTRGWPVSRASEHNVGTWGIWGDDSAERMNVYSANYQAPYRYGSSSAYEPDGSTTTDGSNLTDFNTFCTECHNTTYTIYSTSLARNLRQIDWNVEKHGKGDADGALDEMRNPYDAVMGKVLACTDCHEAHGSPNAYLLRDEVNGEQLDDAITGFTPFCNLPSTDGNKGLGWLCRRCHKDDSNYSGGVVNQWKFVHHYTNYTPDAPYVRTRCYNCHYSSSGEPISCRCCHYHGAQTTDHGEDYPCYVDPYVCAGREPYDRRTF